MEYDNYVLILTVGGSPEPLIKLIHETKPDIVYFLHSEKTTEQAESIQSQFSDDIQWKFKLLVEYQDIQATFDKATEIFLEIEDNDFVHVDFTGGTKVMSAGVVLASTQFKNINKYTYVGSNKDSSRDKDGVGIVLDGEEFIQDQFNPYDVYAIKEFDKGKDFFNKYQFRAALKNFDDAVNNELTDPYKIKLAKFYKKIVLCYDYWDKFEQKLFIIMKI